LGESSESVKVLAPAEPGKVIILVLPLKIETWELAEFEKLYERVIEVVVELEQERVPLGTATLLKVAMQLLEAFIVTIPSLQSASPDQPAKVEEPEIVAVRVTTVLVL
jgi:hypothetical protein